MRSDTMLHIQNLENSVSFEIINDMSECVTLVQLLEKVDNFSHSVSTSRK